MDLFKFVLVPSGQVQVLCPVFQVQMDPEGEKSVFTTRNTSVLIERNIAKGDQT